ncbi:MAG: hypothetical protein ACXACG_02975 [Candidatus Thorarchaeota archaeon]
MSTRYLFSQEDLNQFGQIHGQSFELTKEQYEMLGNKGRTTLSKQQLGLVSEALAGNQTTSEFVNSYRDHFQPLSMSLFVFNDSLWKLMEKKPESVNTMLPMATIPLFYWKKTAITPKNPYGVKRDPNSRLSLNIEPHQSVAFQGLGGEFCGILEGQLVDQETGPRPIIAPTFPGPKEKVPKYEFQEIEIRMQFGNLRANLYPNPRKSIDYTYSEHPKIFYEHGLSVSSEGIEVQLGIGNKRAQPLHGDVMLLLGKRWVSDAPGHEILFYHVWLNAFSDLLK